MIGKALFGCLLLPLIGCAMTADQYAKKWIAEMDARPAEERVPEWNQIRALMLRPVPLVGEESPDFALETRSGDGAIRLSDFRGDRPVVLIFGSWT